MLRPSGKNLPRIHRTAYIDPSASVIGRAYIRKDASVWPGAVLRGDIEPITLGEGCNVQDGAILHTSWRLPVRLGTGVTVGHAAIVHGARVGDFSLIGMGAVLLDGCVIGRECIVGAGALVPEGERVPPRSLVVGLPAKVIRRLTGREIAFLHRRAHEYVLLAKRHRAAF